MPNLACTCESSCLSYNLLVLSIIKNSYHATSIVTYLSNGISDSLSYLENTLILAPPPSAYNIHLLSVALSFLLDLKLSHPFIVQQKYKCFWPTYLLQGQLFKLLVLIYRFESSYFRARNLLKKCFLGTRDWDCTLRLIT